LSLDPEAAASVASVHILVVGPVPPPVDGRAVATSWLVDALRRDGHAVTVLDTHASRLAKIRSCFQACWILLKGNRLDRHIVVASGGLGLVAEILPLLAARMRRTPTTMTHHSGRYVRQSWWLLRLALAVAGPRLQHVVLDAAMGAELAARYGIGSSRIAVVDNAGLMPLPSKPNPEAWRRGVVHLSNLTPDKGLAAVLDVAHRTGIAIRLIGSPSTDAAALLDEAAERGVPFTAVGPRHGEAKMRELAAARCFVFPSSYRHEAQPLVLYEAAAAGCVPIAWRTGWVGEQLSRLGLDEYVFTLGDVDGVAAAVKRLTALDDATFGNEAARVRAAFEGQHMRTRHQFRAVIE
jgi:glycosyltransferase involved in cell wall biosynthesis